MHDTSDHGQSRSSRDGWTAVVTKLVPTRRPRQRPRGRTSPGAGRPSTATAEGAKGRTASCGRRGPGRECPGGDRAGSCGCHPSPSASAWPWPTAWMRRQLRPRAAVRRLVELAASHPAGRRPAPLVTLGWSYDPALLPSLLPGRFREATNSPSAPPKIMRAAAPFAQLCCDPHASCAMACVATPMLPRLDCKGLPEAGALAGNWLKSVLLDSIDPQEKAALPFAVATNGMNSSAVVGQFEPPFESSRAAIS
jgi:hypothetical protein